MTQIFLIRHGEAEGNLYRRAQGQFDTPLTRRGRAQAEALAERFRDIQLAAAYSSDLTRAYETARAAARFSGCTVQRDVRLREFGLGCWEDLPWGNIERQSPEQLAYFSFQPHLWQVPGSEALEAVQQRMLAAFTQIAARHQGERVAVASHGMAIRAFLALIMGVAPEDIREVKHAENTAVALLEAENGSFTVKYYNDASHLPPELTTEGRKGWWRSEGGSDSSNLRFEPFELQSEAGQALFLRCYRDAWQGAHGSLEGFHAETCLKGAQYRAAASPQALQAAWRGDEFIGLIALDERRGTAEKYGWISFCYVKPEERKKGFGTQLIGAAVSRFRALHRDFLRLGVAESNPAVKFYEEMGFVTCGVEPGALEPLRQMELDLRF